MLRPFWMRFLLGLAVLFTVVVVPRSGDAQDAALRRSLTDGELRRLERGRLVARRTSERRGGMLLIGGTSYQVVDLPRENVWRALKDHAGYLRRMLPQTEEVVELRRRDNIRTLRMTHEYGIVSASYAVSFTYDEGAKTIIFRLDETEPHDLRAGWGFIKLRPWGDDGDKTLIAFGMMADVGSGLVSGALRPTLHEWMLKVPWTIKQYLEGRGRRRYGR
jgi:hypothetical protein